MIKCGPATCLTKLARDPVPERAAINLKRQGIGRGGEPDGVTAALTSTDDAHFHFPAKLAGLKQWQFDQEQKNLRLFR